MRIGGYIDRKHKSPDDYLSIDDFYKVYGYTCFYKSSTARVDEIPIEDISITFVCLKFPQKMVKHLTETRKLTITNESPGIYYINGDIVAMQLLVTSQLPPEDNLWLNSLTDDLREKSIINRLSAEYGKHSRNQLYKSVMNIIVHANTKQFEEARNMCEALYELFKDDIEAAKIKGRDEGKLEGKLEGTIISCRSLGATRERTREMLVQNLGYTTDQAEDCLKLYW